MKRSILTIIIIITAYISFGQNCWQQVYNSNTANTFARTIENNYILAGVRFESMVMDWNIFQVDSNGTIEWDTTFYHGNEGMPKCIESTPDSGYIIAGQNGMDAYFLKFDKHNKLNWESSISIANGNVNEINSIVRTNDDNYIAIGGSNTSGYGNGVFLTRIDENGDSVWTKNYFVSSNGHGLSIVESFDGSYYCLAKKNDINVLLLKLDNNGDTLWTRAIDSEYFAISMIVTNDSCFLISAHENSRNLIFIKIDASGNKLWTRKYTSSNTYNYCNSVTQTYDGGYITANYMYSNQQNDNLWIMKLNADGDSIYSITPPFGLRPEKIIQTNDSLFVFLANDDQQNPRLVKTDSSGYIITTIKHLDVSNNKKIVCFPNPTNNKFVIKFSDISDNYAKLTIYNLLGEAVLTQQNYINTQDINTNMLKRGIYLVELIIEDETYTAKLVKE